MSRPPSPRKLPSPSRVPTSPATPITSHVNAYRRRRALGFAPGPREHRDAVPDTDSSDASPTTTNNTGNTSGDGVSNSSTTVLVGPVRQSPASCSPARRRFSRLETRTGTSSAKSKVTFNNTSNKDTYLSPAVQLIRQEDTDGRDSAASSILMDTPGESSSCTKTTFSDGTAQYLNPIHHIKQQETETSDDVNAGSISNDDDEMIKYIPSQEGTLSDMTTEEHRPSLHLLKVDTINSILGSGDTDHHQQKQPPNGPELPLEAQRQQQEGQQRSWWLSIFERLEQEHAAERQSLEQNLHVAESKKSQYKSELREKIHTQLQWLEDRLTAPSHVLPGLHSIHATNSNSTMGSGSTNSVATGPSALASRGSASVNGVEVTLDSAAMYSKLHEMEALVQQVAQERETDRQLLSDRHEKEMLTLQNELENAHKKQRKQWKEKTRVMAELLELTERQHETEKLEWKQEVDTLENTVSQLICDKNELVHGSETTLSDMLHQRHTSNEYKEQLQTLQEKVDQSQLDSSEREQHLRQIIESKSREIARLTMETERQREDAAFQQREIDKLASDLSNKENEVSTLQIDLGHSNQKVKDLTSEHETARSSLSDLESEYARYRELAENVTAEKKNAEHELKLLKKQSDTFREQAANAKEELEEAILEAKNFKEQAADFTEQASISKSQNRMLQKTLARSPTHSRANWGSDESESLDWAMAERDLYQQEVAALQKERDFLKEQITPRNFNEQDVMTKYKESVEKHSELVRRLKDIESKRADDRGSWKLQLESALAESRKLQQEKQKLGKQLQDLVAKLRKTETVQTAEHWRLRLKAAEDDMEQRCSKLVESHTLETSALRNRLRAAEEGSEQAKTEVQQLYENALDENAKLIDRISELSQSLYEYKSLHQKSLVKYDKALNDKSSLIDQMQAYTSVGGDDQNLNSSMNESLQHHQQMFLNAVQDIQNDLSCVKNILHESSDQNTAVDDLKGELKQIHVTLNDAVAELTLEADAMLESRDTIKNAASDVSVGNAGAVLEQQERLLEEFNSLRQAVTKVVGENKEHPVQTNDDAVALTRELITELQQKEAALATAMTELKICKERLDGEISTRQIAESEVATLNDQADAYETELGELQSKNKQLVKMIQNAGLIVDGVLLAERMAARTSRDASPPRGSVRGVESIPVLDEALALAEGMNSINKDTSAMEMLESMSAMMDVHESFSLDQSIQNTGSFSPRKGNRKFYSDGTDEVEIVHETSGCVPGQFSTEQPPRPVDTPLRSDLTEDTFPLREIGKHGGALQQVVEHLYGRCQLLERERMQMMEATLDLLESAREANTAELEAALATVRRKSSQEVARLREQNHAEQERIFHRLCNQCSIER